MKASQILLTAANGFSFIRLSLVARLSKRIQRKRKQYILPLNAVVFRGEGVRDMGPPSKRPATMFMCLAICMVCACHLVIFISEESLFVDAIKLSVFETANFT